MKISNLLSEKKMIKIIFFLYIKVWKFKKKEVDLQEFKRALKRDETGGDKVLESMLISYATEKKYIKKSSNDNDKDEYILNGGFPIIVQRNEDYDKENVLNAIRYGGFFDIQNLKKEYYEDLDIIEELVSSSKVYEGLLSDNVPAGVFKLQAIKKMNKETLSDLELFLYLVEKNPIMLHHEVNPNSENKDFMMSILDKILKDNITLSYEEFAMLNFSLSKDMRKEKFFTINYFSKLIDIARNHNYKFNNFIKYMIGDIINEECFKELVINKDLLSCLNIDVVNYLNDSILDYLLDSNLKDENFIKTLYETYPVVLLCKNLKLTDREVDLIIDYMNRCFVKTSISYSFIKKILLEDCIVSKEKFLLLMESHFESIDFSEDVYHNMYNIIKVEVSKSKLIKMGFQNKFEYYEGIVKVINNYLDVTNDKNLDVTNNKTNVLSRILMDMVQMSYFKENSLREININSLKNLFKVLCADGDFNNLDLSLKERFKESLEDLISVFLINKKLVEDSDIVFIKECFMDFIKKDESSALIMKHVLSILTKYLNGVSFNKMSLKQRIYKEKNIESVLSYFFFLLEKETDIKFKDNDLHEYKKLLWEKNDSDFNKVFSFRNMWVKNSLTSIIRFLIREDSYEYLIKKINKHEFFKIFFKENERDLVNSKYYEHMLKNLSIQDLFKKENEYIVIKCLIKENSFLEEKSNLISSYKIKNKIKLIMQNKNYLIKNRYKIFGLEKSSVSTNAKKVINLKYVNKDILLSAELDEYLIVQRERFEREYISEDDYVSFFLKDESTFFSEVINKTRFYENNKGEIIDKLWYEDNNKIKETQKEKGSFVLMKDASNLELICSVLEKYEDLDDNKFVYFFRDNERNKEVLMSNDTFKKAWNNRFISGDMKNFSSNWIKDLLPFLLKEQMKFNLEKSDGVKVKKSKITKF